MTSISSYFKYYAKLKNSFSELFLPLIAFISLLPRPSWKLGLVFIVIFSLKSTLKTLASLNNSQKIKIGTLFSFILIIIASIFINHPIKDFFNYYTQDSLLFVLFSSALISFSIHEKKILVTNLTYFAWCFVVIFACCLAILQFFGYLNTSSFSASEILWGAPVYRTTGFLPHSTAFGIFLFSLMGINFHLFRNKRSFLIALNSLVIIALATTQIRTLLVISILSCLVMWIISSELKILPSKKQLTYLLFCVIGFFSVLIYFKQKELIPERYRGITSIKGAHGQRYREQTLALEVISARPAGLGTRNINEKISAFRDKSSLANDPWLFKEWRGIHQAFLHHGVLWGIQGMLLCILAFLIPLIIHFLLSEKKISPFNSLNLCVVSTSLFILYSMTDSPFYLEISPILSLVLSVYLVGPQTSYRIFRLESVIILCIALVALFLPKLREMQIKSKRVISVVIDNPSNRENFVFINDRDAILINPDEFYTVHLQEGMHTLRIKTDMDADLILKKDFKRRFNDLPRDLFLISTAPNKAAYGIIYYKINKEGFVEKTIKPFPIPDQLSLIEAPIEVARSGVEFMEETPLDFKYKTKVNRQGQLVPALKQPILVRKNKERKPKYFCWEPAYSYSVMKDACHEEHVNYSWKVVKRVFER